MSPTTMLLAFDIEEWFHLGGGKSDRLFKVPRRNLPTGSGYEHRVEANVHWILDTLEIYDAKATFFVLARVAESHPQLIQEIARRGHRIASHGLQHTFITQQDPGEFRTELRQSIHCLRDLTGQQVLGYRAPYFSMTEWGLDILREEGLVYDASIYPAIYHDLYTKIPALERCRPIERLPNGLWEVRMSSLFIGRHAFPWSGGAIFRLVPYPIFRQGILHILRHQGIFQFYTHPWEFDPGTPHLEGLKAMARLRRYTGLGKTRSRFEKMLREFRFTPIEDALAELAPGEQMPRARSRTNILTSVV